MINSLGIQLTEASGAEAGEILASLPLSYRPVDTAAESVVALEGRPGWAFAAAAAIRAGAVGLIIVEPGPVAEPELTSLIAEHRTTVVINTGWPDNPAVAAAAELIKALVVTDGRLETRLILPTAADLDRALLAQLSLVRALLGPVAWLEILDRDDEGYFAVAGLADFVIDLTAIVTDARPSSSTTRLLLDDGSVELTIPRSNTAQPAHLVHVTPAGALLVPTVFETPQRASWRRLHRLVTSGTDSPDLDDFVADSTTLTRALSRMS